MSKVHKIKEPVRWERALLRLLESSDYIPVDHPLAHVGVAAPFPAPWEAP